jgi:hypothetical protein
MHAFNLPIGMGGVRRSGNAVDAACLAIHQKITFKFTPIVAPEGGRLTKDRDQLGVDGPGNGVGLFVWEEGHQSEFAKAIHHGKYAVGGGVWVAEFVHAV